MITVVTQVLGFVGSLCLLLFGMEMLSNGIQKGAGKSLQTLLHKISGNRFTAVLTGLAVTAIIQSSGATTVMVVSFVNAEIITLTQAIGIIFGANIGTTVTAWVVSLLGFSFSLESAAIPLFGFGFILKYFKKLKIHNFADCFMGFALLFMALGLLKASMNLDPESVSFLLELQNLGVVGLLLSVLIGVVFTALIHSSSATTAIVLTMSANGSLPWELGAAMVLGSNIGSTVDAVMSSFKASVNAKRTALVHVGFNFIGTLIALIFFHPFLELVDRIVPGSPTQTITTHIAMLHTVFNLSATLLFLPFVELNPRAKIYMQHNAGGEYYAFDGEDKGYCYIGIDKKILSLPQVQLLKGYTKLDDELQLFTVEKRAWPLPSTNKRLRELCNDQYIQDEFCHEQNLLLTAGGKKILFCGCAHNGILNVMETLERKFGSSMLPDLVIGGFHLMKCTEFSEADTAEVTEIANRLKSYKAHFATCHCTGIPVFHQMKEIMGEQLSYVRSGDEVEHA